MRTTYALFALLPLAMSVGCVGGEVLDDSQETGVIDTDETGDTEDTDIIPGYKVTFDFAPIEGSPTVAVSKGNDKFSCQAPCQIEVEKTGTWTIAADDPTFWMIGWTKTLSEIDVDATFAYDWSQDYAYGVKVADPTRYISEESGDEFYVYTEIRSGDEIPGLGHDYVAMQGLPVAGIPMTGYSYDWTGGYRWCGYLQEDLEILHFEKWEVDGEVITAEDWQRAH